MKVEDENTLLKIEEQKLLKIKKNFYKSIIKVHKNDFSQIMKNFQIHNKQSENYSIYVIAAKIARGESVSAEELKYIKEHAPSLLAEAERQNEERIENDRNKRDLLNNTKHINVNSNNKGCKDLSKAKSNSTQADVNKTSLELLDKIMNIS